MRTWLVCPLKKNHGKVDIEVCVAKCQTKDACKEYKEANPLPIDPETVEDLGKDPKPKPINLLEPTIQNQRALDAFKRVMSIRTDIEVKFLEMGQILDEMFSNRYHLDLGYTNEKVFCEIVLDLKWRTACYLRNIYLWQSELQIPEKEIVEIGWAKASQILPVAKTKEQAEEWIKKAKEPGMTVHTLNTNVRLARGKITEEEAKKQPETLHIAVYKEQKEVIELAFDTAQKATGSESRGYLFADVICASFLADYPPDIETMKKGELIAKLLGRHEEAFKVKFKGEIIDVSSGEIIIEAE